MNDEDILSSASVGIDWLKNQRPASIKDISRSAQALYLWDIMPSGLIEMLLSKKKGSFWETDKPVLDTARACTALAGCGIVLSETLNWLLEQQEDNNWSNNEIDTSYALIALGDAGIKNEPACEWLLHNYAVEWEYVGTTSLVITALIKQNKSLYRFFIDDRAEWILSKRLFGGWKHIATSNLAIQALVLTGRKDIEKDIDPSIKWLLGKQKKGTWGDITSTSLSLISLRMYLDYFKV